MRHLSVSRPCMGGSRNGYVCLCVRKRARARTRTSVPYAVEVRAVASVRCRRMTHFGAHLLCSLPAMIVCCCYCCYICIANTRYSPLTFPPRCSLSPFSTHICTKYGCDSPVRNGSSEMRCRRMISNLIWIGFLTIVSSVLCSGTSSSLFIMHI